MKRQRVDSSSLGSVGYDAQKKILEVEFRHGGIYRYLGVPESEYEALMASDSLGRFVNERIKPNYTVLVVQRPVRH